ncbi:VOC family protein [Paenacidovorax monticola]|uniref:VOC family protein n=1 Tax=Paenacidovorax monticola TaxID=1926868 RepID=A0A7H0HDL9_9BURK|nr:VOC family protein [Paenacidovorax monticola]QNP58635.1 VOC family protein [Paenacidovorax monticola]
MQVQPYLFFEGRCEEALAFYAKALGAEVTVMMRYKDSPTPQPPGDCAPVPGDNIMHANFRIGETQLMASDGMAQGPAAFKGFSLSITAPDDAGARRIFDALAEGGQVQMPLAPTFFASSFGMVADRFGVSWMVIVPVPMP